MAKFLEGDNLNAELGNLLDNSAKRIILISPFIKLHKRFSSKLLSKIDNPNLAITVVFGKNEENISKSMNKEQFDFFKQFPNIEIRYEKRLHAKYYANEHSAILTSMNLYEYSQDNNIEVGLLLTTTIFGELANGLISNVTGEENADKKAEEYLFKVINQSQLLFEKKPSFESKPLGFGKKYINSNITIDKLSNIFENLESKNTKKYHTSENAPRKTKDEKIEISGYCIRTGEKIPFNPEKPLSREAYKSWNRYADPKYPEKFCHFSGEPSHGETCVGKPILKKHWKVAKEKFYN